MRSNDVQQLYFLIFNLLIVIPLWGLHHGGWSLRHSGEEKKHEKTQLDPSYCIAMTFSGCASHWYSICQYWSPCEGWSWWQRSRQCMTSSPSRWSTVWRNTSSLSTTCSTKSSVVWRGSSRTGSSTLSKTGRELGCYACLLLLLGWYISTWKWLRILMFSKAVNSWFDSAFIDWCKGQCCLKRQHKNWVQHLVKNG